MSWCFYIVGPRNLLAGHPALPPLMVMGVMVMVTTMVFLALARVC